MSTRRFGGTLPDPRAVKEKKKSIVRRALGTTGTLRVIAGIAAAGLVLTACGSEQRQLEHHHPCSNHVGRCGVVEAPSLIGGELSEESSSSDGVDLRASARRSVGVLRRGIDRRRSEPSQPTSKAKVGLAYDLGGRGDQSFNDSAARGLDKAKDEGVTIVGELEATANEPDSAKVDRLEQLASKDANVDHRGRLRLRRAAR